MCSQVTSVHAHARGKKQVHTPASDAGEHLLQGAGERGNSHDPVRLHVFPCAYTSQSHAREGRVPRCGHLPGGLHMRIWLWHCINGWRVVGGELLALPEGTEVALAERTGTAATGGEGGGDGDEEAGGPHWVW